MPTNYEKQITATFRDNAIRSVLFIDDEYLSYSDLSKTQKELLDALSGIAPELSDGELAPVVPEGEGDTKTILADTLEKIEQIRELASVGQGRFNRTKVAEEFVKFFHKEKFICDVESKTNDLKADKIRKSDLIILDYCLTGDDPSKSLQLLRSLSDSKHLNLVVIYTNKPLDRVWQEIASTLRTPNALDEDDFFKDDTASLAMWNTSDDLLKGAWEEVSRTDKVNYVLGKEQEVIDKLRSQFWQDIEEHDDYDGEPEPTDGVIRFLIERDIRKSHLLAEGGKAMPVHGKDQLWIQCGEVFIALCEKGGDDDVEIARQPDIVWKKLEEALHDWYPSFYRVVLSELQNRIEDTNFSMSKILGKPQHEQIALLWSIIKEKDENQLDVSEGILHHLLQDISDELLYRDDKSALKFMREVANNVAENMPPFVGFKKATPQPHNDFLRNTAEIAKANFKDNTEDFDTDFCLSIAHAYNELNSTQRELPRYITTGTVLKSEKGGTTRWYVCVTASCDTVPEQKNDDCASMLAPHRLLTFVKLEEETLSDALKHAEQSVHIFVRDGENRVALRVVGKDSKQPKLVKFIIKHHEIALDGNAKEAISFKTNKRQRSPAYGNMTEDQRDMFVIGQLKPAYAARFQAIQSHHEGRIGVDYVPADFSELVVEDFSI